MSCQGEISGIITSVQRMSVNDGPGIRSTVFLKGCNFRCRWCHNPETLSTRPQLQHISSACRSCGSCVSVCPAGAVKLVGGKAVVDYGVCSVCGMCSEACLYEAMKVVGERVTVNEVLNRVISDKIFYDTSGGGVTVSGGEPFLQGAFTVELLKACCQAGLHTAVETNLSMPWNVICRAIEYVDLWMCDVKTLDANVHREQTGADNGPVLCNLRKLVGTGASVMVRTPVIPGVNDSVACVEGICRFVRSLDADLKYELLGFHTLGFVKYDDLGMANPMAGTSDISFSKLEELRKILKDYNF